MDLITMFMNLVAPPTVLTTLFLLLPPLYSFKLLLSFLSSLFPEDMTNKVEIITGASSGIGEQLAYQYAKKGACLVLVSRREGSLREVADRALDLGSPDVLVVAADVANPDDCRRFIETTMNRLGRLDHLVNNAGIADVCMFDEAADVTKFSPVMDVNFWGSVYLTYFALPHLKRSQGRVVVTSATASWSPLPRMSFYNASKAALTTFFETLRIEFGPEVGVTIATPVWIESEMAKRKFLTKQGRMQVDQETGEVQVGAFPVVYADECAEAIVRAACRGQRYVTVPSWFRVVYLWRVLAPEVMDFCYRMLYVVRPEILGREAPSKVVFDASGGKELLYPSSIQSPEIKKE